MNTPNVYISLDLPLLLIIIIVVVGIPFLRYRWKAKKIASAFKNGDYSEKFLKRCQSLVKGRLSKELSDLGHCYLCDAYLQRNEISRFFEEINMIKNPSLEIMNYIQSLLICYLKDLKLKDVIAENNALESTETWPFWRIGKLKQKHNITFEPSEKTTLFLESVHNPDILLCYDLFWNNDTLKTYREQTN